MIRDLTAKGQNIIILGQQNLFQSEGWIRKDSREGRSRWAVQASLILSWPPKKMSWDPPPPPTKCQMLEFRSSSRSCIALHRDEGTSCYVSIFIQWGPLRTVLLYVDTSTGGALNLSLRWHGFCPRGTPEGRTHCVGKTKAAGSEERWVFSGTESSELRKLMNCTINFCLICSPLAYFPWVMWVYCRSRYFSYLFSAWSNIISQCLDSRQRLSKVDPSKYNIMIWSVKTLLLMTFFFLNQWFNSSNCLHPTPGNGWWWGPLYQWESSGNASAVFTNPSKNRLPRAADGSSRHA